MKTLGSIRPFLSVLFLTTISVQAEDALDRWYLRDARVVNKVRFVGGVFIGVGDNGHILTSANGQTWTARTSGTTAHLRGVAYGGVFPNPNSYVAVGTGGTILISSNAMDWTSIVTTNNCDLNDVAYGNNKFITVATRATINQPNALSSPDGMNWSKVIFPNAQPDQFGSYGTYTLVAVGNIFIAAGSPSIASYIWRSNGGSTWENRGYNYEAIQGIAFGNGRFVTIGFEGPPLVSTDLGLTWGISGTYPCNFSCLQGRAIAFGNSTFVASHSYFSGLVTTTNGLTWTRRSALTGNETISLAFGNGAFVAAGSGGIYQSEPVSTPGLSVTRNSTNALNLTAAGEVGRAYRLQTSTNLSNWSDHFHYTNTLPAMEFIEPVTNHSPLYYRAVTP